MLKRRQTACALPLVLLLASSSTPADDMVTRSFCDAPPHDRVCSVAPKDNTDFDASFIYLNLEKNAQNPFDIFSWQTFVALNWPADEAGRCDRRADWHPPAPAARFLAILQAAG